jgi:CheY-like chemotaxis protein
MIERVLLAEDNPRDVEITLSVLEEAGVRAQVDVVRDGEEAIDYLLRRAAFRMRGPDPSIVLLDIKMPKVNGLDVLRVIRADPALRPLPVVLLTSSRQEQDLAIAHELKADGYLIKPAQPQKLASTLTSAIEAAGARSLAG